MSDQEQHQKASCKERSGAVCIQGDGERFYIATCADNEFPCIRQEPDAFLMAGDSKLSDVNKAWQQYCEVMLRNAIAQQTRG